MVKKFSLVTTLTIALLFSGIFTNSASAAANIDQTQTQPNNKIYYSMDDRWGSMNWSQLTSYFNHYFKNWHKVYWDSQKVERPEVNKPDVEQSEQNTPQVEKPKPETPEVQQPKPETPNQSQDRPVTESSEKEQSASNQLYQLNQFEQQVVELTNNERAKNGLAPLKADWELSRVARHKSSDLAKNNYFSHNSPTYGSPFDMMKSYGISYRTAGENIAKGQRTPQEVVNAWMNSPGHRANILNGNFTHIGVGYVEQGNHWTQMFIGK